MTTDICPVPRSDDKKEESQRDAGPNGHDARSRRSGGDAIPSREECVERMAGLTGLVAMRILSPAQANSIRANLVEIIRYHDRARQGHSSQLADDDVLKLWRDQPELIDLLQPFLTQGQLDLIMREARADERKA